MAMRSARFGLRPINPDPRPPNETRSDSKGWNGSNQFTNHSNQFTNHPYQSSNFVGGGANHPQNRTKPPKPNTATPQQPSSNPTTAQNTNLFEFSPYSAKGKVDPRDATYWDNVSKLMFTANQDYANANYAQSQADIGYNRNLRDLATARSGQERAITESTLTNGLANSGYLDRTQADATRDYLTTLGDVQTDKQSDDQQRELQRQAIRQGFTLNESSELADAAQRSADASADAAANDPGQFSMKDLRREVLRDKLRGAKRDSRGATGQDRRQAMKRIRNIRRNLNHL